MIKLSDKYKWLYRSKTRYYILTGGRGSSKSFSVAVFLIQLLFETGHRILFTRVTLVSAKISIIPEFIHKITLLNLNDFFEITQDSIVNKISGSVIIFKGLKTSSGDQTAHLKSLTGITTWVLDEAEELLDEDLFDKIDFSIRATNRLNRIILIMNPSTREHFVYTKFFESKGVDQFFCGIEENITYIYTNYLDNIKNLSASFIDTIEKIKNSNPEKYKYILLGAWRDKAEGVIFTNWHYGEFNHDLPYLFGQDYGFSVDPTTLIRVAIDKKNMRLYVKEEFYSDIGAELGTQAIYEINKSIAGHDLIIGDSSEDRLIAELQNLGNNIEPAKKGQGSVNSGITLMLDFEIIVDPNSINLGKEFNNYCWLSKKGAVPIDKWNHGIDPTRYALEKLIEGNEIRFFAMESSLTPNFKGKR